MCLNSSELDLGVFVDTFLSKLYILSTHCHTLCNTYIPSGDLCGNCRGGYGVSVLLNKCVTCSNTFGTLIAVLSEHQACILYIYSVLCIKQSCLQLFWMQWYWLAWCCWWVHVPPGYTHVCSTCRWVDFIHHCDTSETCSILYIHLITLQVFSYLSQYFPLTFENLSPYVSWAHIWSISVVIPSLNMHPFNSELSLYS